ncbi:hypothetical protein DFJ73DRAFT_766783 [Zopfochytrium polystomum]|nr:hypothetical protein DFJ73DRAFT_766783 [Zopfochytrium polystomum]
MQRSKRKRRHMRKTEKQIGGNRESKKAIGQLPKRCPNRSTTGGPRRRPNRTAGCGAARRRPSQTRKHRAVRGTAPSEVRRTAPCGAAADEVRRAAPQGAAGAEARQAAPQGAVPTKVGVAGCKNEDRRDKAGKRIRKGDSTPSRRYLPCLSAIERGATGSAVTPSMSKRR